MTFYIILWIIIYLFISVIIYFAMCDEEHEKRWLWTIFWPIALVFELIGNGFFFW